MTDYFKNINGQKRVKKILSNYNLVSKIPHALLFTGPDGVGKENFAILFAQSVNSTLLNEEKKERVLNQISNLSEPFVKYIIPLPRGKNETDSDTPTAKLSNDEMDLLHEELSKKIKNGYHKIKLPKANNIKINSIREIKRFLSLEFSDVACRFIIISSAHLMSEPAQNALLKNLEEPPPGVVFILITSFPKRLRETIRSRCWVINFDPLSYEELVSVLTKYFNVDKNIANTVAPFADGSVTMALKLIKMDIGDLSEKTISILRYSFGKKFHSAFNELNSLLAEQGPDNIQLIIKMIITWLNDLQKYKKNVDHYFFKQHKETLEKFNSKFPNVEPKDLVYRIDKLSSYVKNNININLLSANLIFELSTLPSSSVK